MKKDGLPISGRSHPLTIFRMFGEKKRRLHNEWLYRRIKEDSDGRTSNGE